MQGLYPIIRRARRPLIIRDDDAGPPPAPRVKVPLVGEADVSYAEPVEPRGKHAGAAKGERKR